MKKSRSVFDPKNLENDLEKLNSQMQNPDVWNDSEKVSKIGQEVKRKKEILDKLNAWEQVIDDASTSLELG